MLAKVKRPEGKEVSLEYDALGRRTAKIFNDEITRFVWDGNVLLHEWKYAINQRPQLIIDEEGNVHKNQAEPIENLVTWVYERGNYVPTAKIEGDRKATIISDYIGRPIQAYNDVGNLLWSTEYDIFGKLKNLKGEKSFIPFRQLGQYEDEELGGLYYNRFRYYDSDIGFYICKDPIGLFGGLNIYAFVEDSNIFVDTFGLSPRNGAGTAAGNGSRTTGNKWLKGSHGNAGLFPRDIADKLRNQEFKSFDDFREAFWKEVAAHPELSKEFSKSNITRMTGGNAPIAHSSQWDGKVGSYALHHRTPIHAGGGVFDMDNIMVVTPRFHKEVLDPDYHYGRGNYKYN